MKTVWKKISDVGAIVLTVLMILIMIFTIVSVTMFNQNSRNILGYKFYIVTSGSMRATDFDAGDLIVIQNVDTAKLQAGDIISYISEHPKNYGKTVTHKIREVTEDQYGNRQFVTYGTTTGVNDELPVAEENVLGVYRMKIPKAGKLFFFIKTTPGYILLVLIPFLLLILYYGMKAYVQFRKYRECQLLEIQQEREKLEAEKQSFLQLQEQEKKGETDENHE